jgi:hypothetical protein
MFTVYETDITNSSICYNLHRVVNQIYRLLPLREEGQDWQKPLSTLIIELSGLFNLLPQLNEGLRVLSKLEGLLILGNDLEFYEYRRCIFECCSIISSIEKKLDKE